jgi:ABC-type sugar transport system ATPase subunit
MGVMAPGRERSDCGVILDKLRVVRRSIDQPARELSGGNQQKLLIARALLASPRVLLCDEPTQGVDVGAKREIFQILAEIAERGVGVLLISSDFDELLAVCTRLLVVRDGHIVHELAGAEMSVQAILDRATAAPQEGFRHAPRDQAKEMTS